MIVSKKFVDSSLRMTGSKPENTTCLLFRLGTSTPEGDDIAFNLPVVSNVCDDSQDLEQRSGPIVITGVPEVISAQDNRSIRVAGKPFVFGDPLRMLVELRSLVPGSSSDQGDSTRA